MKSLKQLLRQQLPEVRTSAVLVILIVSLIGFADAGFLAVEHYLGVIPPCSIVEGCEKVLTSEYSFIFGIPTSLLGAIYYLIIVIGSFMYVESRHGAGYIATHHSFILKWILFGTIAGLVMSAWFVYLQAFVIGSYCLYCMGSALTSTVLFVTAVFILRRAVHDMRAVEVIENPAGTLVTK